MSDSNLTKAIDNSIQFYHNCGLGVIKLMMDNQFKPVREHLGSTDLNETVSSDHATGVERKIIVVKKFVEH